MSRRSKTSKKWLQEHFADEFVRQAKRDGVRSRAVYKLQEMDKRDKLFRRSMTVIDLGAAPGGWSEYAKNEVGSDGCVIASDMLRMNPVPGVRFVHGDFSDQRVYESILAAIGTHTVDLVLSDMAPNMSGMMDVDQARSIALAELALDLANKVLSCQGRFLVKVFHGVGFDQFHQRMRNEFMSVKTRKPTASRSRSREVYLLASIRKKQP